VHVGVVVRFVGVSCHDDGQCTWEWSWDVSASVVMTTSSARGCGREMCRHQLSGCLNVCCLFS